MFTRLVLLSLTGKLLAAVAPAAEDEEDGTADTLHTLVGALLSNKCVLI
jgi:hypothetical protein